MQAIRLLFTWLSTIWQQPTVMGVSVWYWLLCVSHLGSKPSLSTVCLDVNMLAERKLSWELIIMQTLAPPPPHLNPLIVYCLL